jgi:vacuolar-type H+-ATPase subunit H
MGRLEQAEAEAEGIIAEARREADRILQKQEARTGEESAAVLRAAEEEGEREREGILEACDERARALRRIASQERERIVRESLALILPESTQETVLS